MGAGFSVCSIWFSSRVVWVWVVGAFGVWVIFRALTCNARVMAGHVAGGSLCAASLICWRVFSYKRLVRVWRVWRRVRFAGGREVGWVRAPLVWAAGVYLNVSGMIAVMRFAWSCISAVSDGWIVCPSGRGRPVIGHVGRVWFDIYFNSLCSIWVMTRRACSACCGITPLPRALMASCHVRPGTWVMCPSGRPIIHSTNAGFMRQPPLGPVVFTGGASRPSTVSHVWTARA